MTAIPQRRTSLPYSGPRRLDRSRPHRTSALQAVPMQARPALAAVPDPTLRPAPQVEARGFVLHVGMTEAAASAAGTSLARLATELRRHVEAVVPGAEVAAAVAIVPSGTPGADVDVVRRALGDPTAPPGLRAELVQAQAPSPAPEPERPPAVPGILIDLPRREVRLDGERVRLTHKEFELLNVLVENSGRIIGRDELLETLWKDAHEVPNERTIDVHVRRLRTKLGRLAGTVRTERGHGYRFTEHPDVAFWPAPEYCI
ncbi:winged helix-turn-helix domain-containing protein [Citricoccus sp. SGAir0253]|uniref:winged helix-turn-helix domain-containing protein n=1 Tax=Citricoccus sp. SGAir0253 TaxID=2567881 RepID=UPI001FED6CD5|nr:winged helix-turn-helix domain-containing protein [Citricoccus sp. SGAir0253]